MDLLNLEPHSITKGTLGKHFLIYGPPSTRKTTVASNFPRPLLLATEIGYSFIPGVKAVNIDSWYTFKQAVNQLKRQEVRDEYDTVIIDTVSLLSEQCVNYINNKLGVESLSDAEWGKGWTDYKKELGQTFNLLAQKGYGIVFIAHSKEQRNEAGEITSAEPAVDNSTMRIINALVDVILFLNKEEGEEGKSVYAYSQLPPHIITKSRIRGLAPRFEFDYDNLEEEMEKAIAEVGVQTTEKVVKKEVERLTLDELKKEIISHAQRAEQLNLIHAAEQILKDALKGLPLSEVQDVHYDSLLAVNQAMKDLIQED